MDNGCLFSCKGKCWLKPLDDDKTKFDLCDKVSKNICPLFLAKQKTKEEKEKWKVF